MKLSISNIGWSAENDTAIYKMMAKYKFSGLEIAPTRIFPESPYDRNAEASTWREQIKTEYGFCISSMQSIWYGRQEKIFGTQDERQILAEYTKKAIDFACSIGCNNLVLGCPRNRNLPDGVEKDLALPFFKEIGDYADKNGTAIGMEANPPIYHTNYINDTASALTLIEQVDSGGFKLNLDVGTMIYNGEDVSVLIGKVHLINHVHVSEPWLKPIETRTLHHELKNVLMNEAYQGFVSIEMGKVENLAIIEEKLSYIGEIFGR